MNALVLSMTVGLDVVTRDIPPPKMRSQYTFQMPCMPVLDWETFILFVWYSCCKACVNVKEIRAKRLIH